MEEKLKNDCVGVVRITQDSAHVDPSNYLWIQTNATHTRNIFTGGLSDVQSRMQSAASFAYIPQFARYPYRNNVRDFRIVNLLQVIEEMQSDGLKDIRNRIIHYNNIGDKVRKEEEKAKLPYITHTGIFTPRRNEGLQLPGFTYQLDIDNPSQPDKILERIINDKELEVMFASISTSGRGVKALLFLKSLMCLQSSWTAEQYSKAYHQVSEILTNYFNSEYGVKIDGQMKAISQPFFLFYSDNLFVNPKYKKWVSK
jgi:hypothetical protein